MNFELPPHELPSWFTYPSEFLRIVGQGLTDLTPWYIMTAEDARSRRRGLAERYPARDLVPFARRQDNDDVACWSSERPGAVFIVHDFASPGWERGGDFPAFWAWFRSAIEELIDWE